MTDQPAVGAWLARPCKLLFVPIRILVLTNLYPSHAVGGYEPLCRDVVQPLRQGHEVAVLSTRFRVEGSAASEDKEQGVFSVELPVERTAQLLG